MCCGSDPGWRKCWEEGQLGSCSCQVPQAEAVVGWVQHCCILEELVPLQSHAAAQRLLCSTLLVILGLQEDTLSELL